MMAMTKRMPNKNHPLLVTDVTGTEHTAPLFRWWVGMFVLMLYSQYHFHVVTQIVMSVRRRHVALVGASRERALIFPDLLPSRVHAAAPIFTRTTSSSTTAAISNRPSGICVSVSARASGSLLLSLCLRPQLVVTPRHELRQ
jgi:hypothetical protein